MFPPPPHGAPAGPPPMGAAPSPFGGPPPMGPQYPTTQPGGVMALMQPLLAAQAHDLATLQAAQMEAAKAALIQAMAGAPNPAGAMAMTMPGGAPGALAASDANDNDGDEPIGG